MYVPDGVNDAACHGGSSLVLSNTEARCAFELAADCSSGSSCKGAKDLAKQGNTLCNSDSLTSTIYHDHITNSFASRGCSSLSLLHSVASVFGHPVRFRGRHIDRIANARPRLQGK